MIYSQMHALLYRVINKWNKTQKRKQWKSLPGQKQMTYFEEGNQLFEPQLAGPSTFLPDCCSAETARGVLSVLEKLEADRYLEFVKNYFRSGLQNFGDKWRYADINTALYGICKNIKVESYLEIGVRRGRSMSMVASLAPECRIVGFDLWIQNYAGLENPGKDFVCNELKKVGCRGEVNFIDGNSRQTVPQYFKDHPDAYFDLVTVDGDHSWGGAIADLRNVMPRIKVGGFLVFDDICSYEHPYLQKVWDREVVRNPRFASAHFNEVGLGVGFAMRRY